MAGRRKWIVTLSIILLLLLAAAGACYVKGWSFNRKQSGDDRERWKEALSEEVLEEYDSGVTYKELVEEPETYQLRTTVAFSGTVKAVSDARSGRRQVDIQTGDGDLIAYMEDKTGNLEISPGEEYVICGQFQGMDSDGKTPIIQVLAAGKLNEPELTGDGGFSEIPRPRLN